MVMLMLATVLWLGECDKKNSFSHTQWVFI